METEHLHVYSPSNFPRRLSTTLRRNYSSPEFSATGNNVNNNDGSGGVRNNAFLNNGSTSDISSALSLSFLTINEECESDKKPNPPSNNDSSPGKDSGGGDPPPPPNNGHVHQPKSPWRWDRKLPIIKWLPNYTLRKMGYDFFAGFIVGLTLIPQGLAMAALARLPAEYGLYSGFMGCFVYIFFGTVKQMTIGPTAIMSIMTLAYAAEKPPEYAVLLCFTTGLVTFLAGILQLGFIVNFVSIPVTSAFTSAAAITICYSQTKAFLGLSGRFTGTGFVSIITGVVNNFEHINVWDVAVSAISITAILILRKLEWICSCMKTASKPWTKSIWLISTARGVIVMGVCTIVFYVIGDIKIVGFLGTVKQGLPSFTPPPFSYERTNVTDSSQESFSLLQLLRDDGSALLVLPFLALMEHTLLVKMYSGSKTVDYSQEMVGIGLSNILSSFVSGMPITGAFPRTGVNAAAGVETPMGGLVTGALVLISLQYLTPWFYYIPKGALAAVNAMGAVFTIDAALPRRLWKSKRMDFVPWFITFSVSLLAGLEYGILLGFLTSIAYLLYWAASPKIRVNRCKILSTSGIRCIFVDLDRSLTFPSAEYTRSVIMKCGDRWAANTLPVIIDCFHIHFVDYTASQGIVDLFRVFNEKKQTLILYRLKPSILRIVTSLLEMDSVPFKAAQTQAELHKMLETENTEDNNKMELENKFLRVIPQIEIESDFDLLTDSAAPTLLYPDTTERPHIANVAFTVEDSEDNIITKL